MFILFWDAASKQVKAMNGSGRSGAKCTLDTIRTDLGIKDGQTGAIPMSSVHSVTVPGAPAGWVDTVERFGSGKLDMAKILAPAIQLGEKGFPVSEVTGYYVSICNSCRSKADCPSGEGLSVPFAQHRPTLQKCSRKIPRQKTAFEHLGRERS